MVCMDRTNAASDCGMPFKYSSSSSHGFLGNSIKLNDSSIVSIVHVSLNGEPM